MKHDAPASERPRGGRRVFVSVLLVAVPAAIAATHRTDLYYTLSSVALLSIASAGVWLTFYIGRINIGQGAYALVGGYVSAILVTTYGLSFWFSLPIAGLFCAAVEHPRSACRSCRLRGVYFAMVTLVLTEVARLSALALSDHQWRQGHHQHPAARPDQASSASTIVPPFDTFAERNAAFYFLSVAIDGAVLRRRSIGSSIRGSASCSRRCDRTRSSPRRWDVNVPALRVLAYAISSFLGGVGGAIFVAIAQSIYPSSFTVNDSVNFMLNCFLGGLGYVFGPMLGTLVLYFGWDLLFSGRRSISS